MRAGLDLCELPKINFRKRSVLFALSDVTGALINILQSALDPGERIEHSAHDPQVARPAAVPGDASGPPALDAATYRRRNVIERGVNRYDTAK